MDDGSEQPARLLARVDEIAEVAATDDRVVAVVALGSVGVEVERLDRWSDVDVMIVVADGTAEDLLDQPHRLAAADDIAWWFRSGDSSLKLMFGDGIFAEIDVRERSALPGVQRAEGRIVWRAEGVDDDVAAGVTAPSGVARTLEWCLGEALSNLYVGLLRWHRGERLSAMRFVQHYAVDRVLELLAIENTTIDGERPDRFAPERRAERRFPAAANTIGSFCQGYDRTPQSAAAILAFLAEHFAIDERIERAIRTHLDAS